MKDFFNTILVALLLTESIVLCKILQVFLVRSLCYFLVKGVHGSEISGMHSCHKTSDCLNGFYCKFNDCIAQKPEGSLCLSGNDDECACGKCSILSKSRSWNKICASNDYCFNNGLNRLNQCENDEDCPEEHFCNKAEGSVCMSKLKAGRLCYKNSMCACGKCLRKSYVSRKSMDPLYYDVCDEC